MPCAMWTSACSIISLGLMPAAVRRSSTSVRHQSASVSAMRRMLSPYTRSQRSMTVGRNPSAICRSTRGTICSSMSRTLSSGLGSAKPTASRMTASSSTGTPVSALSSANVLSVSVEKRS